MSVSRNKFPAALAAAFLAIGLQAPVFAHDGSHEAPAGAEETAGVMTNQMVKLLRNYGRAVERDKPKLAEQLSDLIDKRQAALYALVEKNPRLVLLKALPGAVRERVPASIRNAIEQEVDATGVLVGRIGDDFVNGRSRHDFFLEVATPGGKQRFNVNGADASLSNDELMKLVGAELKIRAVLLKDHLVVGDRGKVQVLKAAGGGGSGGTTTTSGGGSSTPVAAPVNETTLVIMANFSDKTLTCTGTDIANRMFSTQTTVSSLNRVFAETSRQQVTFSGQVVGPFSIPYASNGACDYTGWGNALKAAAQAAGINPANFRRVSYAIPPASQCGWSGLAYLGGSFPTQSWVATCGNTGVFVHELGHNLRFHHAATPSSEYGDGSDPMGGAKMVQFNASNRVVAGWQPAGTVVDATSSGSFTLTSVSLTTALTPQVVRIRKADTNEYYYVSLRTGSGFDTNLSTAYKNLVSVHRSPGTLGTKSYVLAQLAAGQAYTDSANGITITPSTISGEGATVAVSMNTPACTTASPTVSVNPVSLNGTPGSTKQYSTTVTNRNGSTCASSTFSMSQSLAAGFSGSFSPSSVTLAPGASASMTWSLTPATAVVDGSYTMAATANDSAAAGNSASSQATYVVIGDSSNPVVTLTSPSNGAVLPRNRITLSASATDANGIARVEFYVDNALVGSDTAAPYSVNWNARKASVGSHVIKVRAIDTSGNMSEATASVTLY